MPDYAIFIVNEKTKEYFAPPCLMETGYDNVGTVYKYAYSNSLTVSRGKDIVNKKLIPNPEYTQLMGKNNGMTKLGTLIYIAREAGITFKMRHPKRDNPRNTIPVISFILRFPDTCMTEPVKKYAKKFGTEFPEHDRKFLSIINHHFDFELMKDKPFIWQDIWIYNYLKYDYDGHKFSRSGLLAKYEREIVFPSEKTYLKVLSFLGINDKTQATDHT